MIGGYVVRCINSRLRLVQDSRLSNPTSSKPAFRFGTIPNGATDFIMLKVSCDWWIYLHTVSILVSDWLQNFPTMHAYMRRYNERTVKAGLGAVKQGKLDAFIYDATVDKIFCAHDNSKTLNTFVVVDSKISHKYPFLPGCSNIFGVKVVYTGYPKSVCL